MRQTRNKAMGTLKKSEETLGEDLYHAIEQYVRVVWRQPIAPHPPPPLPFQVQRLSDKYMADLEDVFVQKEKDILAVS